VIGDVETIEFFTAHGAPGIQLISAAHGSFLLGILMLLFNWKLAVVALAPLVVILLILVAFRRSAYQAFMRLPRTSWADSTGSSSITSRALVCWKAFAALRHARRAMTSEATS